MTTPVADTPLPSRPVPVGDDDQIQPFQLEAAPVRGRLVRLGRAVEQILGQHAYPEPVADLLAQTLAVTVALASLLKYDGVFTVQAQGEGAVRRLVADLVQVGDQPRALRGYAQFDADAVAALPEAPDLAALMRNGYLAFTIDPDAEEAERYQGIVEFTGATIADCIQHYFRQSEQVATGLSVAVGRPNGQWRAGALMVQRLPESSGAAPLASDAEDDWRRTMVLMSTCTAAELTDPALSAHDLLYRLFHNEGVRVFAPLQVEHRCRCSRERVMDVLRTLSRQDLEDMRVDGVVEVACQFCNTAHRFDDAALAALFAA